MSEARPSYEQAVSNLRERLGQDGHLLENGLSLIVKEVAGVRSLFGRYPEAVLGLMNAMAGIGRTDIPQTVIGKLTALNAVLDNNPLVKDANGVGLSASEEERKKLDEAYSKPGFEALREVALNMHIPGSPGEQQMTLATKIGASAQT